MRRNLRPIERFPADASRSPRRRPQPGYFDQPRSEATKPAPLPRDRRFALAGVAALAVVVSAGAWWSAREAGGKPASTRFALPQSRDARAEVALTAQQMQDAAAREALATLTGIPSEDLAAPPEQALLPVPADAILAAPLDLSPADDAVAATRSKGSPVLIFDAGSGKVATGPMGSGAGDDIVLRVAPTPVSATPAGRRDPKALVTKGTLIPAVLETAIEGDTPGGVRAVVTTDVRSSDGNRVLIPRSSKLVGRYRSSGDGAGARTLVIWTQVRRPDGGKVALGSAGGSGDKAFLDSFGKARMQSIVSGGDARVRTGEPIRVYAAGDVDMTRGK